MIQNTENASDKSVNNTKVHVSCQSDNANLVFEHNGTPFTYAELTALINGNSFKPKDNIGQFGTGFVETTNLSPIINVSGICIDEEETI